MEEVKKEGVFRQWLGQHKGLIFKVVYAYADTPHDRDDLFQDITFQLWVSIPSFQNASSSATWVYRIALYTALAWKRKERKHHKGRVSVIEISERVPEDSGETIENRELVDLLYAELRRLSPGDTALALLYLDGLSYRDMAETLGISESNVGVRLTRIRKRLAKTMNGDDDGIH